MNVKQQSGRQRRVDAYATVRPVARWPLSPLAALVPLSLLGCADARTTAVVYASVDAEVAEWAEHAFRDAHPDQAVRIVTLAGDEAVRRLRSEAGAPEADAVWGLPSWRLAEAASSGLLEAAAPGWAADVPDALKDAGGRWVGVSADPLVLAFNSDSLSRSRAPRDWVDLLHPRWSGEILLPEPGPVDAMTALLAQRLWQAHEEYGDALQGMDWFARMDAWRGGYFADADEAARALADGQGLLALLPLSAAESLRGAGRPVDYRVPEAGTPVLVRGVALVAGAPHREVARAFLEWLGSDEAVRGFLDGTPLLPARGFPGGAAPEGGLHPGGAASGASFPWIERVAPALVPLWFPADPVAERVEGWVAAWRDDVRGRAANLF